MSQDNGHGTLQIDFDEESNRYRVDFPVDGAPVSMAIVEAMSEITGEDPLAMPPLADSVGIDVEALDRLYQPTRPGVGLESSSVVCRYLGHRITISSDGSMEIRPKDGE